MSRPCVDALEQHAFHLGDEIVLAARELRFAQFGQDGLEHLRLGDPRIEDQRRVVVRGIEFVQESAAERGFAAADLADQHDKALFLPHAVFQVLQGFLMGRTEVKKRGSGVMLNGISVNP